MIVYLTGYRHYAVEAFEIESFHYLIKPIMETKFTKLMRRILTRIKERKTFRDIEKMFSIKTKDNIIQLKYDNIYYFEKYFRKLKVYTSDETIKEEEAKAMIVCAFVEPIAKDLPLEYAVEMSNLINLELGGIID